MSSSTPSNSTPTVTNLFDTLPPPAEDEHFTTVSEGPGTVVERIVSHGQTTPEGRWLRQERAEWVILLRGKARLLFRGDDKELELSPGDALTIPSGQEHRVMMTDPDGPSVWLAVHYNAGRTLA